VGWVEDRLGVSLEAGGRHSAFATHNRLLSLGPDCYLEVIAVDPDVLELRRGANEWALTVAPDGRMPLGGLAPSRILWRAPPPSTLLPDRGVRLVELRLSSREPDVLAEVVAGVGGAIVVLEGAPGLAATFLTPSGHVEIGN
jgi:hypothetical protein